MGKLLVLVGRCPLLSLVVLLGGAALSCWMYGLSFENLQVQGLYGFLLRHGSSGRDGSFSDSEEWHMQRRNVSDSEGRRNVPTSDYVFPIVALGKTDGTCNCTLRASSPAVSCRCDLVDSPSCSSSSSSAMAEKKAEPWFARGRAWHYPSQLPRCSMDVCFNYTRCSNQSELLIYSYSKPSPPVRYFTLLNTTAYHTHDPHRACLFFVFLDSNSPHKVLPETLPYWGHNGLNHVLVTFADMWHRRGPDPKRMGFASILASDMHETIYRPGFDISLTLPGHVHLDSLQSIPPLEREYLATFRGVRYLGAPNEEGSLRSYDSFRSIHNGKDVIVVTSCKHKTNDIKRQADPQLGRHCEEDEAEHARYSFRGLMNTTFGLVPAGRQPNSYRLVEVMAAGIVPVLIVDNYVKPFDTLIQWHQCILQFPSSQMHLILPTLRAMVARARDDQDELMQRQRSCIHIYNHFLRDDPTLLRAAIASLKARLYGALPFKPSVVND